MRTRRRAVRVALRACRAPLASHRISLDGKRKMYEAFTAVPRPPGGTRSERVTIAGVPVLRLRPPGDVAAGTLIYLHGGAYALGSAEGYRGLAARLAAAAGMTVVVPDYSRSPEARYPVSLEEMVAVYSALLAEGLDPKKTVIAGDSAGGGLALALAMALRDRGIEGPAALGLICPWADLAIDIDGVRPAGRDPLILPSMASEWAPRYVGEHDPRRCRESRRCTGTWRACRRSSCTTLATTRCRSTRTRLKSSVPLGCSTIGGSRSCGTYSTCRPACWRRRTKR
jgi:epsilon-lactone hydrolase